ncbi:hypothetical protein FGB62_22g836 [Gracilaria domingensis]|nr:hypothetical protein FGB62_22g836 [Gracilaria domingensis]
MFTELARRLESRTRDTTNKRSVSSAPSALAGWGDDKNLRCLRDITVSTLSIRQGAIISSASTVSIPARTVRAMVGCWTGAEAPFDSPDHETVESIMSSENLDRAQYGGRVIETPCPFSLSGRKENKITLTLEIFSTQQSNPNTGDYQSTAMFRNVRTAQVLTMNKQGQKPVIERSFRAICGVSKGN